MRHYLPGHRHVMPLAALLLWLFASPLAFAALQLSPDFAGEYINRQVELYEDPDQRFSLADILQRQVPGGQAVGLSNAARGATKGLSRSAWWLRLDVANDTAETVPWILEFLYPHTDLLDLYYIDAQGHITTINTGDTRPLSHRPLPSESFAFPLQTPAHSQATVILRFAYQDAGLIEMSGRVWNAATYRLHRDVSYGLYGVLAGAGIFAIIFTLIVHFGNRRTPFYWYLAYALSTLGSFVANTGLGYRFLWHDSPALTDGLHLILIGLSFAFAIQFNRAFLNTRRQLPHIDKLLQLLLILALAVLPAYLLGLRMLAASLILGLGLSFVIMPLIGLWSWRVLKQTDARWYVLAWSVWSFFIFIAGTHMLGALELTNTARWFNRTGLLLETVLLGFAMIDQIHVLRDSKTQAEAQLFTHLQNATSQLEAQVKARTAELEQAHHQAQQMAETDILTGIGNRRFFFTYGERILRLAQREQKPLALVMLDIDHFKQINDVHGHAAGDQAIKVMAQLCQQRLRSSDVLGRIGGEEFAFLLFNTDITDATILAQHLCELIPLTHIDSSSGVISMTASFGIAALAPDDQQLEGLLQRADAALYRAKAKGRNRIESAAPDQQQEAPA